MAIGPIQIIVFGFDRTDQFKGEILEELRRLRNRGMIRVIDVFLAKKAPGGGLSSVELSWLNEQEKQEFGTVVGKLLEVGGGAVAAPQNRSEALELATALIRHHPGRPARCRRRHPGRQGSRSIALRAHLGHPVPGCHPPRRRPWPGAGLHHPGGLDDRRGGDRGHR